ncbi:unnamed protein product, partial [Rotaria sp. Silwood1]
MNDAIQKYVQEYGIKPMELTHNFKKAIVSYDYEAEILERQYLKETSNAYQVDISTQLLKMRRNVEKSRRDLLELKQRVFFNKSSISFNSLDDHHQHQILCRCEMTSLHANYLINMKKSFNGKKLDSIALYLLEAESTYFRYQYQFDTELAKLWQNHRNLVKDQ